MNPFTRNSLVLLLGLLLGFSLAVGGGVFADKSDNQASQAIPLESIRALGEVLQRIKDHYVDEVDDETLLRNAIRGMLTGLDPHSTYLDEKAATELRVGTSGEFGGLGIVVGMEDGFVKVVSPIDDTPAQRAGVRTGDLIIRLDEKPVKGMSLDEAINMMRGEPGTQIELTIMRQGNTAPIKVKLTRDRIRVQSVRSRMLEPGYGYVRISNFQMRTAADMRKAINDLKKENKGSLHGLVLDLRNNPGGLLDSAIAISDAFLSQGDIVSIRGRSEDSRKVSTATPGDLLNGAPIVVLVNGGSASASEIVAGALQDHKRAVIMGHSTFGKGSVQSVIDLQDNTAIKLTTALYYTPNLRSIQAHGIEPDILLDDVTVTAAAAAEVKPLREADLARHLDNGDGKSPAKENGNNNERLALASEDYPAYQALNLLKGLHLLGQR